MEKSSSSICRGVHMTALRTDKFKFGLLSLSFILPLTAENASAANLAARVRFATYRSSATGSTPLPLRRAAAKRAKR